MGASNIWMALVVLAASLVTSCAAFSTRPRVEISGVDGETEARVWLIRDRGNGITEVFRCADLAGEQEIPRPVCIRPPFGDRPAGR